MATVLYGDKPHADVEAGNRVDTAEAAPPGADADASASQAPLAPEAALSPDATATPTVPSPPPVGPMSPTVAPAALRGLVLGLAAAAAVFAGLSLGGIALAWSRAMAPVTQLTLMLVGGALVAAGVAYIVAVRPAAVSHV
jgi:hypothetical protein